ncbi:MAG: MotA/TolQ/ExbB proton channel family protein [Rhizobiaceae bacterium]
MIDTLSASIGFLVGQGGPVVTLLLVLSVFALALSLVKLHQFWRERVGSERRAKSALHHWLHGRFADAQRAVDNDRSATGAVLGAAMRMSQAHATRQTIEEEMGRIALLRIHGLQRGFRALDAIAQIAPLLGLFGTVLGMIEAFRQLQGAGNAVDPSMLAGGIWVALLTTAVGLAVAMPVSLILTWFESRVENERVAIESIAGEFLTRGGGLAEDQAPSAREPVHHLPLERSHAH